MTFVFELLSNQTVIAMGQLLVGKFLKEREGFENKFIPVLTFLLAVLGYQVLPATAQAAGFLAPAAPVAASAVMALFQTLLVTGTHSTFKNTVVPVGKWALIKAAEAVLGRWLPKEK